MSAQTTAASRASCVRTWTLMHLRWFGDAVPILPLTCESICAVAAQMKASGYRSFMNYIDTLKSQHIEHYEWTPFLTLCRARCLASTQRGIGPSRQSLELPLQRIRDLDLDDTPLVPGGPCCPTQWATLCGFHMLRGAESSCALASSLRVDTDSLTETLSLPVSKTDPQAVGCLRTWGCTCRPAGESPVGVCGLETPEHKPLCPYHAARSLLAHHHARFASSSGTLPPDFPLFAASDGDWCTRSGFLGSIAELARRLDVNPIDALQRCTVGEHTWRVSGSRHLAALDVPLPIICLMARWGGETIMRYVKDAPLSSLTRIYLDRAAAADGAFRAVAAAAATVGAQPVVAPVLSSAETTAAYQVDPLAEPVVEVPSVTLPFFKRAGAQSRVHMVSLPPRISLRGVTLPCGRQFTDDGTFYAAVPANAKRCDKCGTAPTWISAMAIASALELGSDSD